MSTFDQASLVMIPSGYKTSKVYSIKPTDGSGDMSFSRSNDTATRVNSAGLIEKVRTNINVYSNDFSNASWLKLANATVSGTRVADPFGGNTGWQFVYDGTNAGRIEQAISSVTVGTYTFSVWLRVASGTQSAAIGVGASESTFTLTTTWQRFSVTGASITDNVYPRVRCDSATTIQAYGAQTELSDFGATPYIGPTLGSAVSVGPVANVPRLNYLNSSCPRLLLEPQRQNVITYSEQFDNAAWTKAALGGSALTTVVTANQAVSPDGYTNADKVFMSLGGGTTSSDWARLQSAAFNVTSGTAYTITFWAWASQSSEVGKKVRVGVGGNTALLDFTLTATATRFTVTYTAASTGTDSLLFQLRGAQGLSATAEFFLWGAQLEAGAYATSYIPTLGAAVTRGADACSKTGISSLIGSTAGTFFIDATVTTASSNADFFSLSNTVDPALGAYILYMAGSNGNVELYTLPSNTSILLKSGNNRNTRLKIAFAYTSGSVACYVNGVSVYTSTSFTLAANLSRLDINSNYVPSGYGDTELNQALLFKTRLTNAQLAELTTL